jgi:nitrate/TMAO reductase-like tetraheme cytochrome c subunit
MRAITLLTCLLWFSSATAGAQNSCLKCHEKQEGKFGAPAREWKTSIHFENAITCSDCHGGDPRSEDMGEAMNPAKGFLGSPSPTQVPDFCGKCHNAVRDNYSQSAHAMALRAGLKAPNCVTCHTAHRQQKVTLDLINPQTCGQCHTYDRAARLKEAMRGMETDLTAMERRENQVFLEGLDVEGEKKTLFDARNRAHRLTHVLDISRILLELGAVRADLPALDSRVRAKEKVIQDRKVLGTGLMLFFLVGAALAWFTHKKLMETDTARTPFRE